MPKVQEIKRHQALTILPVKTDIVQLSFHYLYITYTDL